MRKVALVLFATLLLSTSGWGWGSEGHQIIAMIAQDHLDKSTKVMIRSLVGSNQLYLIATWADEVRPERPETKPWHYVDIPFGEQYDAARDCPPPGSCVVQKITDFMNILTDKKAPRDQRAEALKFLVHFVADLHQPMHAAKEAEGGNGIHVRFLGKELCGPYPCNLHAVWDTSMILHTELRERDYANQLEELIRRQGLNTKPAGTPEQWANESLRLAEPAWVPDQTDLGEAYYQQQIKIVDRQMALAGIRLAKLLNESIGRMKPQDFQ
jgi:hypothetical protein